MVSVKLRPANTASYEVLAIYPTMSISALMNLLYHGAVNHDALLRQGVVRAGVKHAAADIGSFQNTAMTRHARQSQHHETSRG
jgi:hypothetical protein